MLQKIKIISVAIGIIFFLLSLLSTLQYFRFQHLLFEISKSTIEVPADALRRDIERSIATGIALHTNAQVPLMLTSVIQNNPIVLSIELTNSSSREREVLWSAGTRPASSQRAEQANRSNRTAPSAKPGDTPVFVQDWPVVDPLGVTVAQLVFISDKSEALNIAAKARAKLLALATTLCLASLALLTPILFFLLASLDKIVLAAKSVVLGSTPDQKALMGSEVCQFALSAREAKDLANTVLAKFLAPLNADEAKSVPTTTSGKVSPT
jgi:hypothetical protein